MEQHVSLFKKIKALEEIGKKNPIFSKFIISMFIQSLGRRKTYALEMYSDVLKLIIFNSTIIKNSNFNIFKYTSIEKLDDALQLLLKKHHATKMLKSIISNKYKHLITRNSINLFVELFANNITKSELQVMLGKKLAAYKTSKQFCEAIKKVIANYSDFSMAAVLKKISNENLNVDIVYSCLEKNQLILKINDYYASKALGSHHWCISYSEKYFNDYTANQNQDKALRELGCLYRNGSNNQYFIFNFGYSDVRSMIGATFSNDKLIAVHAKDDSNYHRNVFIYEYNYLFDINKNINNIEVDILKIQKKIESLKGSIYYLELISRFVIDYYKNSSYIHDYIMNELKYSLERMNKESPSEYICHLLSQGKNNFNIKFNDKYLYSIINNANIKRNLKMRICSEYISDVSLFFRHIEYLDNCKLLHKGSSAALWISLINNFYYAGTWDQNKENYELFIGFINKYYKDFLDNKYIEGILEDVHQSIN